MDEEGKKPGSFKEIGNKKIVPRTRSRQLKFLGHIMWIGIWGNVNLIEHNEVKRDRDMQRTYLVILCD